MPSQSPINGSTKWRTSTSAARAGISHQGHAFQKDSDGSTLVATPNDWRLKTFSDVTGVFVVGCAWFNELSFDRRCRPLYHLYAIALRILLYFIHDVVHKEDAAP